MSYWYVFSQSAFFCIALWGLGSHSIPQTEQELSARGDGAKEVVLYFEEGQQLSDLLLFIGYRAAGEVTVSVAAGADWQIVQSGGRTGFRVRME